MIALTCTCKKKLTVKNELAGKKVKCPGCGKIVPVPGEVHAPTSPEDMRGLPPTASPASIQDAPTQMRRNEDLHARNTASSASPIDNTESPEPHDEETELTDFLAPPQSADELGRLGNFRILKILGHGGMGVVFLA